LVNTSIPGIHILATCRKVHEEAKYILTPRLRQVVRNAPKIIIEAEELVGVHSLRCALIGVRANILDRIACTVHWKKRIRAIDQYRTGKRTAESLRKALFLSKFVERGDIGALNAITSFMLRVAKYKETKKDNGPFKYPHVTLIIAVPSSFRPLTVTITTSRPAAVCYLLRGLHRPRSFTGRADLEWLLRRFAFHASYTAGTWPALSFSVNLMNVVDTSSRRTTPPMSVRDFRAAIAAGVRDARSDGEGLLEYGGLVNEEERYDLV
jgi:hypothetical protein